MVFWVKQIWLVALPFGNSIILNFLCTVKFTIAWWDGWLHRAISRHPLPLRPSQTQLNTTNSLYGDATPTFPVLWCWLLHNLHLKKNLLWKHTYRLNRPQMWSHSTQLMPHNFNYHYAELIHSYSKAFIHEPKATVWMLLIRYSQLCQTQRQLLSM